MLDIARDAALLTLGAACGFIAQRLRARARLDDDAARMKREREAERAGRTRAERDVRALRLELARVSADGEATTTSSATSATDVRYALRALGTFRSAFRRRLGAPRQPSLVPLARGRVALHAHVPASALEGLEEFSHCWLLFVFHENTDFHASVTREIGKTGKTGAADGPRTTTRGKIRVPRLNGEKRGCLATRTPHRPCPIGLSLVEIVSVGERWLDVAGADVVNGSPILDVKPYVPYSDCNAEARAPLWVSGPVDDGGDGPLHVDEVVMTDAGELAVRRAWEAMKKRSLYRDADEFVAFTLQALGRDLRSYHQRLKPTPTSAPAAASVAGNGDEDHAADDDIEWKCALDGVVVSYKHVGKRVFVVGAEKDTADDPDAYYTTSVK